ncbi:mycofactocin system transcriptional regulator [Thermomonospora echinospora]|uniref:Mycofactocin system transcriptional regulator n=1 Tax=Thermomonospora echinospora TaxID=1992 RepID=A0A1H6C2W0_9ACTN|nr:mycofactocin system transcriptional regulator [Thermomonospora echinospora]SEG67223.1 mycofactocin system transcriptional regulator [Thermomonospora echinospora]
MPETTDRPSAARAPRVGRRPRTSRAELEQVALRLFAERGFEETTVDDIAAAAGIGRRTFFRYYGSKNDVVWGDFERELEHMRAWFAGCPPEIPMMDALRRAVVAFNRLDPDQVPWHRLRMMMILQVPALQAHSTLRYADWRAVVAVFVAGRLGQPADALMPQAIAYACLGAAVASYEQWLRHDDADLGELLNRAMSALAHGFQGALDPPGPVSGQTPTG